VTCILSLSSEDMGNLDLRGARSGQSKIK